MTTTDPLAYDGAPRPITEEEARTIAHAEYVISSRGAAMYRGSDGGFYPFDPLRLRQDAVQYVNAKRRALRDQIMAGECTHTVFYNAARDTFYCA